MKTVPCKIRRIIIDQLRPGMYVVNVAPSWIPTPFLLHKPLLKSTTSIEQCQWCGVNDVWIDVSRGEGPVWTGAHAAGSSYSGVVPIGAMGAPGSRLGQLTPSGNRCVSDWEFG